MAKANTTTTSAMLGCAMIAILIGSVTASGTAAAGPAHLYTSLVHELMREFDVYRVYTDYQWRTKIDTTKAALMDIDPAHANVYAFIFRVPFVSGWRLNLLSINPMQSADENFYSQSNAILVFKEWIDNLRATALPHLSDCMVDYFGHRLVASELGLTYGPGLVQVRSFLQKQLQDLERGTASLPPATDISHFNAILCPTPAGATRFVDAVGVPMAIYSGLMHGGGGDGGGGGGDAQPLVLPRETLAVYALTADTDEEKDAAAEPMCMYVSPSNVVGRASAAGGSFSDKITIEVSPQYMRDNRNLAGLHYGTLVHLRLVKSHYLVQDGDGSATVVEYLPVIATPTKLTLSYNYARRPLIEFLQLSELALEHFRDTLQARYRVLYIGQYITIPIDTAAAHIFQGGAGAAFYNTGVIEVQLRVQTLFAVADDGELQPALQRVAHLKASQPELVFTVSLFANLLAKMRERAPEMQREELRALAMEHNIRKAEQTAEDAEREQASAAVTRLRKEAQVRDSAHICSRVTENAAADEVADAGPPLAMVTIALQLPPPLAQVRYQISARATIADLKHCVIAYYFEHAMVGKDAATTTSIDFPAVIEEVRITNAGTRSDSYDPELVEASMRYFVNFDHGTLRRSRG